jgi:hypothetical protein
MFLIERKLMGPVDSAAGRRGSAKAARATWRRGAASDVLRRAAVAVAIAGTACALSLIFGNREAHAQITSFSVGTDSATTYPGNLPSFPDEHVTFVPSAAANGYLVFASSSLTGGVGGAVVLQTEDLQTFSFATSLGYADQVMTPPVAFTKCNPTYDSEFDENYVGPGTVIADPTLPAGNLIMIYEAEKHCPGGVNQFDYYATAGLARSSDNGQTWPPPTAAELGGANRYPVLKSATLEPTQAENPQVNLGNAIPSAAIDGSFLYIVYEYVTSPTSPPNNMMRVARANLVTDNVGGTLRFHKWYNGAFSQDGIGGLDTSPLPSLGCNGVQKQASLAFDDDLGLYVMVFLCLDGAQSQGGWYYATATSLTLENWTAPQLISGSLMPWLNPCSGDSAGGTQFDGFYPSLMSPAAAQGHIHNTGRIYFLNGCDGGPNRAFEYREFTITGTHAAASLTATHDFDGDGFSDIVWQNIRGNLAVWLMNGGAVLQSAGLGPVTSAYSIIGQHDFNGDGKADLLWRDSSGNVSMWFMSGTSVGAAASVGNLAPNWTLYGTGNLNGDGSGDLLWRDASTGTVAVWFMNGAAVASTATFGALPASWTIVGDADGAILWRDTAGDIALWGLQNGQVTSSSGLGAVTANFTVQGVGDFNGDGGLDILWRDSNSGTLSIWFTDGTNVTSAAVVSTLPSNWSVAQVGDYDGDGKSDILLLDSAGDLALWQMNGATVAASLGVGNVGPTWQVQNINAN